MSQLRLYFRRLQSFPPPRFFSFASTQHQKTPVPTSSPSTESPDASESLAAVPSPVAQPPMELMDVPDVLAAHLTAGRLDSEHEFRE